MGGRDWVELRLSRSGRACELYSREEPDTWPSSKDDGALAVKFVTRPRCDPRAESLAESRPERGDLWCDLWVRVAQVSSSPSLPKISVEAAHDSLL
mmetsp:Transcript_39801/g.106781  ORF Transcript_39801/g.106781 Transcript_39801/m.106781 type:complete len:96 (+) Transcript_39801:368-655(+)